MKLKIVDYIKVKFDDIDCTLSQIITKLSALPSDIFNIINQKQNGLNTIEIVDGVAQLTDAKYQYLDSAYNGTLAIQLPEDDSFFTEIHLFIKTGAPLKIYERSISSSNTWNSGYGWSSQYIKVTPGSSINFTPQTVSTGSIELLQYFAMDNTRKAVVGKNATVTLNASTNYVKINCWDANQQVPEYIYINGEKYNLAITTVESDISTLYVAMSDVTFPTNCTYSEELVLQEDTVQEIVFTKLNNEWICGKVEEESEDEGLSSQSYMVRLTKAEYEMLEEKNSDTLYIIIG